MGNCNMNLVIKDVLENYEGEKGIKEFAKKLESWNSIPLL